MFVDLEQLVPVQLEECLNVLLLISEYFLNHLMFVDLEQLGP